MRLCFIVDARSPIARNWIEYFSAKGYEVHIISSYPFFPHVPSAETEQVVHLTASGLGGYGSAGSTSANSTRLRSAVLRFVDGSLALPVHRIRTSLVVRRLPRKAEALGQAIRRIKPDLVHAMRLPYEGIAAALANPLAPLVCSVWGNDLTLHAATSKAVGRLTRQALARIDALHCDCHRDSRLALAHGFSPLKPVVVLPGCGGLQPAIFHEGSANGLAASLDLGPRRDLVVNPRGLRGYVRTDVFFRAARLILERRPSVRFACCSMHGSGAAEAWVQRLGLRDAVRLLPPLSREHMGELFRSAAVSVSLGTHDGTPNTLLEAMASGCVPVAGDIESIREWITHGENGLLCDPTNPESVAESVTRALDDETLALRSRAHNAAQIRERANYATVMDQAAAFYEDVVMRYRRSL